MVNHHHLLGDGPRHVIVLHGWLEDHRGFAGLWDHLDGERFRWAFMDYRGYGGSRDRSGTYTLDEIAGDVLELADHLGWEHFDLVGHSMGGVAAQRVLVHAPSRVRRLVGVNPVPASGVPFDPDSWTLFRGAVSEPANRRAIVDFTTGGRLPARWLDRMVENSLQTADRAAFAAYLEQWAGAGFAGDVRGMRLPVKVLAGAHDAALTAEFLRDTWLSHYPGAELEVLEGAGHYPAHETPLALARVLEDFLGR
ncbi:MAG TPA: alpha/beta fold hydrolase [Pseudonocardiaceae bacterium]